MFDFKKINKTLLLLLTVVLLLTTAVQAEKKIEFWTINLSPSFDDYFSAKIAEFEKQNPAYKIVWEDINFSAINQKFKYRAAEAELPEVVNLSPQLMTSLLEADLLYPISDFEEDYSKNYYPRLWENGYYQGKYYAFPWYLSSKLMLYNQEIFKIAGLDPQQKISSKQELFEIAAEITAQTGVYALMPQLKIEHEFLEAGIDLLKKEGKQLKAAFNTAAAEKIIKQYQQLRKKGVIPRDAFQAGFNIALERYKNNDLAVLFAGPQFVKDIAAESEYLKDQTLLAKIPPAEAGIINSPLMNLVIAKKADFKEKAAEFAAFITSAEAQAEFSQNSSVLSSAFSSEKAKSAAKKEKKTINSFASLENQAKTILKKQLPRNKDLTLIHPEADRMLRIMETEFTRAFLGKITAKKALVNMEFKWNQILAEENNND